MKKSLLIIVIAVAGYFGYTKYFEPMMKKGNNMSASNPSPCIERYPKKIFIAADATGSLNNNGISKLNMQQLERIVDTLKVTGGQIGLLIINENCGKTPLLRVTVQKQPIKPGYPVQEISETAYNFGQRLQQYKKDIKLYMADSACYYSKVLPRVEKFMQDAGSILNIAYSRLAMTSDCIGALNVSTKYQTEPIRNNQIMQRISLFISDMLHDAPVNKSALQNPLSSGDYYVVRTKKFPDCLPEELEYVEYENIDASLDEILK